MHLPSPLPGEREKPERPYPTSRSGRDGAAAVLI